MPRFIRPLLAVLLGLAALGVAPAGAAPAPTGAPYESADEYPDPPTPTEAAPLPELGENEDANWVPFLGDHELWCTNGNPGYSGCIGHHGYSALDIGMPIGTKVYASGPGTVIAADSQGDARGRFVEIRHPDGIRSRYYHLSTIVVHVGQVVERGTWIGRSGMTGHTTSPHLHYEERTASGGDKDPGVMFGTVNGRLVSYPPARYGSWWDTPYGTRIVNDSFAVDNTSLYWGGPGVATGDLNGDGFDDVVTGVPGEDTDPPRDPPPTIDSGEAFVVYGGEGGASTTGGQRVIQGLNGAPGTMANNEVFGAAVATGDFDGDEIDDLAVGAPAATVGGQRAAGEVVVLYGSADGVQPARSGRDGLLLHGLDPESGDQFGASLTTGDFDGDGDDELVVGSPGEGIARRALAGAVSVFDGSRDGLGTTPRELSANTAAIAGAPEAGDRLGVAVAAGDVNGDGIDDLAVGIPGEDTPDTGSPVTADEGAVLVLLGRPAGSRPGLRGDGSVQISADSPHVAGDGRAMDQLGTTVAVGDVHGDGFADVLVGAIGRDVGRAADAGAVLVLKGSEVGIRAAGSRQITADAPDVAGQSQAGDRLGSSLALGDLDGDGAADLLVGIAGQVVSGRSKAGAVLVLHGGAAGPRGVGSRQLHAGTSSTGLADQAEVGDVLGASGAIGDLDGNGYGDLVIGAPGEDVTGVIDTGALTIVAGSEAGLGVRTSTLFHGDNVGPQSHAEPVDRWGGLFPIYLR
jgi:hypothetical protein